MTHWHKSSLFSSFSLFILELPNTRTLRNTTNLHSLHSFLQSNYQVSDSVNTKSITRVLSSEACKVMRAMKNQRANGILGKELWQLCFKSFLQNWHKVILSPFSSYKCPYNKHRPQKRLLTSLLCWNAFHPNEFAATSPEMKFTWPSHYGNQRHQNAPQSTPWLKQPLKTKYSRVREVLQGPGLPE